jgi:hypothetical protein
MVNRFMKGAVVGGIAGAFVAAAAIALAGTGVGGIFNLGQDNVVNAQTSLRGAAAGNVQLRVENQSNGVGVVGQSESGKGVYGKHTATTGVEPGIQGETASATGAGVVAKNTGGGPGLSALVNPGKAPLAVNSTTRVANLNADQLDGQSSSAFLPANGDLVFWYSAWDYVATHLNVTETRHAGPLVSVGSTGTVDKAFDAVGIPLDQPQNIFGVPLKLKSVTVCFEAAGAQIVGTRLAYSETNQSTPVYGDQFVHSAPAPTCYDVAPSTPTVAAGSLYLALDIQFYESQGTHLHLYSVRVRLGT